MCSFFCFNSSSFSNSFLSSFCFSLSSSALESFLDNNFSAIDFLSSSFLTGSSNLASIRLTRAILYLRIDLTFTFEGGFVLPLDHSNKFSSFPILTSSDFICLKIKSFTALTAFELLLYIGAFKNSFFNGIVNNLSSAIFSLSLCFSPAPTPFLMLITRRMNFSHTFIYFRNYPNRSPPCLLVLFCKTKFFCLGFYCGHNYLLTILKSLDSGSSLINNSFNCKSDKGELICPWLAS